MKDLPRAVQQAVQAQSAGTTVKGFAKETENGTGAIGQATAGGKIKRIERVTEGGATSYEASYIKAGKNFESAVKPDGSPVNGR
jgi:hypothetical protein